MTRMWFLLVLALGFASAVHSGALPPAPEPLPGVVKKGDWQSSLIASREALLQWEARRDAQVLPETGLAQGPWYLLGPLSPKSKELARLRAAPIVDLKERFSGEDGREIGWVVCDRIRDGEVNDLPVTAGGGTDSVYVLSRTVTMPPEPPQAPAKGDRIAPRPRSDFEITLSADRGQAVWLPGRTGPGVQSILPLVRGGATLPLAAGEHQLLLFLQPGADGRRRFVYALRAPNARGGAGAESQRQARRVDLYRQLREQLTAPADLLQSRWEAEAGLWIVNPKRTVYDWAPGESDAYLKPLYAQAVQERLEKFDRILADPEGVRGQVLAPVKERIAAWSAALGRAFKPEADPATLRGILYRVAAVQETLVLAARVRSIRLAIEDQRETFGERYPKAAASLARLADADARIASLWDKVLAETSVEPSATIAAETAALDALQAEILLDTPMLAFDRLLVMKGRPSFASNWGGPNSIGSEMVVLSPVRPDGKQTVIRKGAVSDLDLNWDGQRILFSDGRVLWEMNADGGGLRQVSATNPPVSHYDGCYLPNGRIVCVSAACEQAVPCTGGGGVGNLHLMDADGRNERRVSYDQDHDWNPAVLNDGRVVYSRWEYTDLPHYFSRIVFRMNPDGSNQMEYYGSGSYWPNAVYWPRPIPGDPTKIVCVVSGHHGVSRVGELVLLDPARGRREAEGAIQKIPGYGRKVEPIIRDQLVSDVWPRFAAPYPLAEPETDRGAGKYFLACVQRDAASTWDLCLVDIFDNITPILTGGWMTPIPLRPRPLPPVLASTLNPAQPDGVILLSDIYQGPGLRGYPRGSITALRIGTHHYRYPGNGDTRASSFEGGWDVKRILGTVPVQKDGSAFFRVPANTPIFLQPLDAEGKAQQLMRSWYTAMPGEFASCVGCHDRQNSGPPSALNLAARRAPSKIVPWQGPVRGFSFDREVQPVLDRHCAGCHDGRPGEPAGGQARADDLRAKSLHPGYRENYSPAYLALQKYVRRAGYESDMHMHAPAEFDADTSALVQLLKKGHYNVRLAAEEWERLYTWIDYNIPYPANWRESHRPPPDASVALRAANQKIFANIVDRDEDPLPLPPVAKYEPPKPVSTRAAAPPRVQGWPFTEAQAKAAQTNAGPPALELDLGAGVTMKLRLVPAGRFAMGAPAGFPDEMPQAEAVIEKPFYIGQFEVTCAQYARFDPTHENGFIEGRGKDRTTRGTSIGASNDPVVRISWNEATAYCAWLSKTTGRRCSLPTEAQWEWACRAGTDAPHAFGAYAPGRNNLANIADASIAAWNYGRCEPGYSDGAGFLCPGGRYAPNAWGLFDMHGNAAEWCLTTYRPYPYKAGDGRDDPATPGAKVVRGGSWNDTMRFASSASRWRYPAHQPVYNVGFRVQVCR